MPAAKKAARKSAKRTTKRAGAKRGKSALSRKQLAQRKYAGRMSGIRKRARKAAGGRGRVAKRSAATTLRRKLGLSAGT